MFTWERGRQNSNYCKMLLFENKFILPFDFYILRYGEGSYIPEHVDEVNDYNHYRCNIILKKPKSGGIFECEKSIIDTNRVKLFRPDKYKHKLTEITKGTRYVLSFGWITKKA